MSNFLLGKKRTQREHDEEDEYDFFSKSKEEIEELEKKKQKEDIKEDIKETKQNLSPEKPKLDDSDKPIQKLIPSAFSLFSSNKEEPKYNNNEPAGKISNPFFESKKDDTAKDKTSSLFSNPFLPSTKLFESSSPLFSNKNNKPQNQLNFTSFFEQSSADKGENKPKIENTFFFNKDKNKDDNDKNEEVNNDSQDDMFGADNDECSGENNQKEEIIPLQSDSFSEYNKLISKQINNIFIFSKKKNKYFSKGNGFLSIEKSKDVNKNIYAIVFRNKDGIKISEGFINEKLSKCNYYEKNNKHFANITYVQFEKKDKDKVKDEQKESDIPIIGFAKVPFLTKEEFKEFKKVFDDAILSMKKGESGEDKDKSDDNNKKDVKKNGH